MPEISHFLGIVIAMYYRDPHRRTFTLFTEISKGRLRFRLTM